MSEFNVGDRVVPGEGARHCEYYVDEMADAIGHVHHIDDIGDDGSCHLSGVGGDYAWPISCLTHAGKDAEPVLEEAIRAIHDKDDPVFRRRAGHDARWDLFAAAALTGLLAGGDSVSNREPIKAEAERWADLMTETPDEE